MLSRFHNPRCPFQFVFRQNKTHSLNQSHPNKGIVLTLKFDSMEHTVFKTKKALWRWLVIAFIDVILNTPENIFRLTVILGVIEPNSADSELYLLVRMFAQVFYFSQFAFNGFYLALFIYDKTLDSTVTTKSARSENSFRKPSENVCQPNATENELPLLR